MHKPTRALCAIVSAALCECGGEVSEPPPTPAPVLTVIPDTGTLRIGRHLRLTAQVGGAADWRVRWGSLNASVALVDSSGVVTGVGAGVASVTAALVADGRATDTARITVLPPLTISLDPARDTLSVGSAIRLAVSVSPTPASRVHWASSAAGIAAVDSTGLVTALSPGDATIEASSDEDDASKGTSRIHVTDRRLGMVAGDAQVGLVGSGLADSLVVRVTGGTGQAIAGEPVAWIGTTGALLEPATSVTDANGVARARWALAPRVGTDTAVAVADGVHVRFTALAGAPAPLGLSSPLVRIGVPNPAVYIPGRGRVRGIMLFLQLSGIEPDLSPDSVYRRLVPRAAAAFSEYSFGRMSLEVQPFRRWIRLPKSSWRDYPGIDDLMREVLAQVDDEVDFSLYDLIYLVQSPAGDGCATGFVGGTLGASVLHADGKSLDSFVVFCRDEYEAEYGGNLLLYAAAESFGLWGLVDFTGGQVRYPAGSWDVMSDLALMRHFTAFNKNWLGWLNSDEVKAISAGGIEEVVTPIEREGGVKALVAKLDTATAVYAEVRAPIGMDGTICSTGVLLYEVDARRDVGGGILHVLPYHAQPAEAWGCGLLPDAPFPARVRYDDPSGRYTMEVVDKTDAGYRVRLRKR